MNSVDILGTQVSVVSMDQACSLVKQWIENDEHRYITVANVHTITDATSDPELKTAHSKAGMVIPDGRPLSWCGRLFGAREMVQIRGTDFMLEMCRRSLTEGWSHYFYGSTEVVLERLVSELRNRYPGISVAGTRSPPFRALSDEEVLEDIKSISDSGANIVWVGLGAPKQEIWMSRHCGTTSAHALVGVGAAFDFVAGTKSEAPRWMQRNGLEWLYRLFDEPTRLWRRYLTTNSRFIWLTTLQAINRMVRGDR